MKTVMLIEKNEQGNKDIVCVDVCFSIYISKMHLTYPLLYLQYKEYSYGQVVCFVSFSINLKNEAKASINWSPSIA